MTLVSVLVSVGSSFPFATLHGVARSVPHESRITIGCFRISAFRCEHIFSEDLDRSIEALGIEVLKSPVRAPKANAYCERLIGSLRRECLDWFIPLNERHLRRMTRGWTAHYNHARLHKSLGPGILAPPPALPVRRQIHRHEVSEGFLIKKKSILGGLHHEYRLEKVAA